MNETFRLHRDQIETAFDRLNAELAGRDVRAEVHVVGGAVLCLGFAARSTTKDVGAWFVPVQDVRAAAAIVASELDLPEDWLNDAAKAFLPERAGFERWRSWSHLEVFLADARTLLAMKCAAARTAEDAGDIRFLAKHLGLSTSEEILAIVLAYYPPERRPVRCRLLLEEVFDDGG
jgi:hypothetical protein